MSEFADVDCKDHGCCMNENSHPRKKDLEQGGDEIVLHSASGVLPADWKPSFGCFTDIGMSNRSELISIRGPVKSNDWQPGYLTFNPYKVATVHPPNWGDPYISEELHSPTVKPFYPTQEDYDELNKLDLPAPSPQGRPRWNDYFMGLAFIASQRSPDRSTKHGCVIVHDRHVLGTGYNGFAPGEDDEALATTFPKPYHRIIHAERNAIKNCTIDPKYLKGVIAYVTGQCCGDCAEYLAQNGVTTWVIANRRGFSNPRPECQEKFDRVVRDYGVSLIRTTPKLDWLVSNDFMNDLRSQGFLS